MKLPVAEVANDNGMQTCAPHRATLSKASCGKRWTRAQADDYVAREQFAACGSCKHGKRNAKEAV